MKRSLIIHLSVYAIKLFEACSPIYAAAEHESLVLVRLLC